MMDDASVFDRPYNPGVRRALWTLVLAALSACSAPSIPCVPPESAPIPHLPAASSNAVRAENAALGAVDWQITKPAEHGEVEGFVAEPSIAAGEPVHFFVRTASSSTFTVEIWRLGWYGGAGGRRVAGPETFARVEQPLPRIEPEVNTIHCDWSVSATIAGDRRWVTGIYLAKLRAASGHERYAPFVVRDDQAVGGVMFQTSLTTSLAYNDWGGWSSYGDGGRRSKKTSLDRPFTRGNGAGDFFMYEIPVLRFLEREGVPVNYVNNLDVHRHGERVAAQRLFLSVGHDEYWSLEMREALEQARDQGVSLGFFSANVGYWSVRFEPNDRGAPDRVMVTYKEDAARQDPYYKDGAHHQRSSGRFRDAPIDRPEKLLIGEQYQTGIWGFTADWTERNPGHWLMEGTGLKEGDTLPGLVGGEGDQREPDAPSCVTLLGSTDITTSKGRTGKAETTIYASDSGAWVFAWGSFNLGFGLDTFAEPNTDPTRDSAAAKQIVRNFLARVYSTP
ncbi:MAG: DUF6605 domain-containing protein [Myxococcota bacterium]